MSGILSWFDIFKKKEELNPKLFLDSRNIELWNSLNNKKNIKLLRTSKKGDAKVISKGNISTIYLNSKSTSACLTHELLHVWMKDLEIYIGSSIKYTIRNHNNLKISFLMGYWKASAIGLNILKYSPNLLN